MKSLMSDTKKRRLKLAALATGIVLSLICQALPPEYRVACDTVMKICTGNL